MKTPHLFTLIVLATLAACLLVAAPYAQNSAPQPPAVPAQGPMPETAWRDYQQADQEMNAAYRALLAVYGEKDKDAREKLKAAQIGWIKYRDLAVASEISLLQNNDARDEAHHRALESLTRERTARLQRMLKAMTVTDSTTTAIHR